MDSLKPFQPSLPKHVATILQSIQEKGFEAYLVGGCVRDLILERPVHDWDIATSAAPSDIARIFRKTVMTGERYGTVSVLMGCDIMPVEVTSFRTDGVYLDGRRPASVTLSVSLADDLGRRDFTMNAIAMSGNGDFVDPFDGYDDIQDSIIRCVGVANERFKEDALRMFRAFRFAAQLGFSIEQTTQDAICTNAYRASLISAERIRVELEKTLLSRKPEFIADMINARLLDAYLTEQKQKDMSKDTLSRFPILPEETVIRWCALCAVLQSDNLIESCNAFLRSLRLDARTTKLCSTALSILPRFHETIDNDRNDIVSIKRLISRHGADAVRCTASIINITEDTSMTEPSVLQYYQLVNTIVFSGECCTLKDLAISGHDLIEIGCEPGPHLKTILNSLLDQVIEHPNDNKRELLLQLAHHFLATKL